MGESFLTCKWKCPKLRENFDNFGCVFSNSSWRNAAKREIKIQVTSREIFATFFTEKGLIALIPKVCLQIEIKIKPYKTQSCTYFLVCTQFTRKIQMVFIYFKIILLLFDYTCLHFLPTPLPHPSQTLLPPLLPPSPLVLSMCPL